MTTIAAITNGSSTWVGSDTMGVIGDGRRIDPVKKWFLHDEWAIGLSGDYRVLCLMAENRGKIFDDLSCPGEFAERMLNLLHDRHYQPKPADGSAPFYNNSMILARAGRIWDVDGSFAYDEIPIGKLWARGSGCEYALGAAAGVAADHRSRPGSGVSHHDMLMLALKVANIYDVNTGENIFVHELTEVIA